MAYHIDTGLIKDKFKTDCECPLCEIQSIVEEQFLHEFLNDAVMEENTRLKVNRLGFCAEHFEKLFARQNKLSLALQIQTRTNTVKSAITEVKNYRQALKQAKELERLSSTCIICDLTEESMIKYYKTIAQMYLRENNFYKTILSTKGFCIKHYAELLKYSKYAGVANKEYLSLLSAHQKRHLDRLQNELKEFCDKHDYRNALKPLGNSETSLPRMGIKLYGKKFD